MLQILWVLLLFIGALDSKEIAVSFPVALLLYELVIETHDRKFRVPLQAGLLTLVYVIGKNTGPGAISRLGAYHPQVSLSNYLGNYADYAAQFTFQSHAGSRIMIAFVLIGSIALASLLRNRILVWASLFNLVAILPIAFIPPRNGFVFFVPITGWAAYGSVLLAEIRQAAIFRRRSLRAPAQLGLVIEQSLFVLRPEVKQAQTDLLRVVHDEQNRNRAAWISLRESLPASVKDKKILALHDTTRIQRRYCE